MLPLQSETHSSTPKRETALDVFWVFLKLGLTSFGGPVAHIGYFRTEFVERKKWMNDRVFADLVALCQFTPGPASSKVGIGVGLAVAGIPGAIAAWLAFTAPSAIALVLFAYGVDAYSESLNAGWLHGLKVAAVAVVANAVWGMAKNLSPDAPRFTLAVAASIIVLLWPGSIGQLTAIVVGAIAGIGLLGVHAQDQQIEMTMPVSKITGTVSLTTFFVLLGALPLLTVAYPSEALSRFDSFYRAGSLVFGGGHVVLPLLQSEVVPVGWVANDAFLAGYGAAQAIPGPLFAFAAYLGAIMQGTPNGWQGALLCTVAIFLPAFLLTIGALPFWNDLRRVRNVRSALTGINASVVGLLLAALYQPVWTSAIHSPKDFALGMIIFLLLAFWRAPPWLVVIFAAAAGALLQHAGA